MKKLVIVLMFGLIWGHWWVNSSQAATIQIPPLNAGVGYSVKDNAPVYLATFDIANKGNFNLEGGYAGRNEESYDELALALTYKLVDSGFINFPILKYFSARVGGFVGLGSVNTQDIADAKLDFGPVVTGLVSVKF